MTMMKMRELCVCVLLVSAVQCVMDTNWCDTLKATQKGSSVPMPQFSAEFFTTIEVTNNEDSEVDIKKMYYSVKNQILRVDTLRPTNQSLDFVLPAQDEFLENTYIDGAGGSCIANPLEQTDLALEYNIRRDMDTNKLKLPRVTYMIPNSQITSPVYIQEEDVRGIRAQRWHVCAFQEWSQNTISAEIYYSSKDYSMPGSAVSVPLRLDMTTKMPTGAISTVRKDFVDYIDHVHAHAKELEVPYMMSCDGAPILTQDVLPKVPESFTFFAIQRDFGDINSMEPKKPVIAFMKETYSSSMSIYIQDHEMSWSANKVTDVKDRIVHDYISGLEYDIGLTTGTCSVHKIDTDSADFLQQANGLVKQMKPADFFQLDNFDYQYMGKHSHFDRDIPADVYTAEKDIGTDANPSTILMTWWFASKDFLKEMGFKDDYMMPLRYRIQNSDPAMLEVTDLYQFKTPGNQADLFPDLSPCFPVGKEIYLAVVMSGRYDIVYLNDPIKFMDAFRVAIMTNSKVVSLVRIAALTVQPASNDKVLVQFTLLDKPSQIGNSLQEISEVGNDVNWPMLKKAFDDKSFKLTFKNDFGTQSSQVVSYWRQFQDPSSFAGRSEKIAAATSSKGFGSGAMGGLGVGMLLLGLLLGFGGAKGVNRYQNIVPDISMERLGNRP